MEGTVVSSKDTATIHSEILDVREITSKPTGAGFVESVFSAIAASLDTGTVALPYAVMINGYILGPALILLGSYLSYHASMLLVRVAHKTGGTTYEEIAMAVYGPRFSKATSIINIFSLLAFNCSFIVFMKEAVPLLIWRQFRDQLDQIPQWIQDTDEGRMFWGAVYAFGILFPLSLARDLSSISFTNQLGVICNLYLCVIVMVEFFTNDAIVPDRMANLRKMEPFNFSVRGVVVSFPLIIFSYMQQICIPLIFDELKNKDYKHMKKVVVCGSTFVSFFYIMIGIFGYAIFLAPPISDELCDQNILSANFNGSKMMVLGNLALLLSVGLTAPMDLFPCKNAIEELFFKDKQMTACQNFFVTLGMITISASLALFV